jgi:hypothetical protein
MTDLFVRLKRAIDGDFYVIAVDERRIILGNHRCPFGAIVQREPALCRVTSSVFGGIAARNAGRSAAFSTSELPRATLSVDLSYGSDVMPLPICGVRLLRRSQGRPGGRPRSR